MHQKPTLKPSQCKPTYHESTFRYNFKNNQGVEIKTTYNKQLIAGSFQNNTIHIHPNEYVSAKIKTSLASKRYKSA